MRKKKHIHKHYLKAKHKKYIFASVLFFFFFSKHTMSIPTPPGPITLLRYIIQTQSTRSNDPITNSINNLISNHIIIDKVASVNVFFFFFFFFASFFAVLYNILFFSFIILLGWLILLHGCFAVLIFSYVWYIFLVSGFLLFLRRIDFYLLWFYYSLCLECVYGI